MAPSATIILFSVQYTCSSGNGVARLPGRNSGQKAQKGPQKKISGRILADFYQKQAEKRPQKICILYIKNQIYQLKKRYMPLGGAGDS